MPQAPLLEDPWFVRAFDRAWLRLYAHRSDAQAEAQIAHVLRLLGVSVGQRVLDVGCGAGRHARALAARGVRVTGVDLSPDMLEVARERSPHLPGKPDYLRGDIRHLPFARQCHGAISMFTSVGYFDSRAEDVQVFAGVARALRPEGRFLLDYLNAAQVRSGLVAAETRTEAALHIEIERRIADGPHGPCIFKRVRATDPASARPVAAFEERVRLYTPAEVDGLLEEAGLVPLGAPLGDLNGAAFDAASPRLVRVAARR